MHNALGKTVNPLPRMIHLFGCLVIGLSFGRIAIAAESQGAASATAVQPSTIWSRDDAAHLLRRAGFGGTPQQIDALHALGRTNAVEYLLTGNLPDGATPVFAKVELKPFEPTPVAEPDPKERETMRDMMTQARKDGEYVATIGAPTSAQVAPPGYYMLFILDGQRIPSMATMVHVR